MHFSTVSEWFDWMATLHRSEMELGLDRVKAVAMRLGVLSPGCTVIIVGGTNGKGSTVAGLEAIYLAAGYQVGAFTSPYLYKHNEQVRVSGCEANDEEFCQAYEKVAAALSETTLTPFEFTTLAALVIFKKYPLDILILEVGLGGRLDAVNIMDADASVVTTIALDHTDWLGDTREKIGFEKAGIFRTAKPAICGEEDPPHALIEHAKKIGASLFCQQKDFFYEEKENSWSWSYGNTIYSDLPRNRLSTQNMSTVLMTITAMQPLLPVPLSAIKNGLSAAALPGRIQQMDGPIKEIYDVSHNPASVALLAKHLQRMPREGKRRAVFSMLADKDMLGSIERIQDEIDEWYVAPLVAKRAATVEVLLTTFADCGIEVKMFRTIYDAYVSAKQDSLEKDCVVVFGSFYTVGSVLPST